MFLHDFGRNVVFSRKGVVLACFWMKRCVFTERCCFSVLLDEMLRFHEIGGIFGAALVEMLRFHERLRFRVFLAKRGFFGIKSVFMCCGLVLLFLFIYKGIYSRNWCFCYFL